MPRRSGDFENNDDIYKEIENHDKGLNLTTNRSWTGFRDFYQWLTTLLYFFDRC